MSTQKELVDSMLSREVLHTPAYIAAFRVVDRAHFVDAQDGVYEDHPLPIGWDQTISQPSTVAFMLELLAPQEGDHILDVGSGSGWTTALLAHIVGESGRVYGVEIVPELVQYGQKNLSRYTDTNATIVPARKDVYGLPDHAPYDRILVSATHTDIPADLIEQLQVGGRIVMPVAHDIVVYDKHESHPTTKRFSGFSFVPLVDPSFAS